MLLTQQSLSDSEVGRSPDLLRIYGEDPSPPWLHSPYYDP